MLNWWRLSSLSLPLHSGGMLLWWLTMTQHFLVYVSLTLCTDIMNIRLGSVLAVQIHVFLCFADNKTTYSYLACLNLATWDLTSRRKRGLSGMKMTPTSAASAGKRHTRMNILQLWIWNSVPMAKPQPGKKRPIKSMLIFHKAFFLSVFNVQITVMLYFCTSYLHLKHCID